MQINLDRDIATTYTVTGYTRDSVTIHGVRYTESLIVTPHHIIAPWGPAHPEDIQVEHMESLVALNPSLVLLGTGPSTRLTGAWLEHIVACKLPFELMDTCAACRTFNLLALERRSVVAALLLAP